MAQFQAPQETLQFVIALLKLPAVSQIDFHFGGLHVRNIDKIAELVGSGRIALWVDEALPRGHATYDPASTPTRPNTLFVSDPRVDNDITRVTIVHEAVHAYFDYRRTAGFRFGEEAAAFVAERVFAEEAGIAYSTRGSDVMWAALRIVRRHNLATTSGVHLAPADYQHIYTALSRQASYNRVRHVRITNGGIA